jgi:hypothetical protein
MPVSIMMFPAVTKKGIAIKAKESIPPKIRIISTVKGISIAMRKTIEVRRVAIKTGKPKKIRKINRRKTRATLNMVLS